MSENKPLTTLVEVRGELETLLKQLRFRSVPLDILRMELSLIANRIAPTDPPEKPVIRCPQCGEETAEDSEYPGWLFCLHGLFSKCPLTGFRPEWFEKGGGLLCPSCGKLGEKSPGLKREASHCPNPLCRVGVFWETSKDSQREKTS